MRINSGCVTGGILAGGEARRLGCHDKGLLSGGQLHFVERLNNSMQPHVARILLSANRNVQIYQQAGFDPIQDRCVGFQGPLAGLEALLHACPTAWLWLMPVDAVKTPPDLLDKLIGAQEESGAPIVAVRVNGRENPVCALLSNNLRDELSVALAAGERKVIRWYGERVKWVDYHQEDNQWIWSVNTPKELALAQQQLNDQN